MTAVRRLALPTRAALALLLALLVVLQTLSFPGQFAHQHPDRPVLQWAWTAFTGAELLCFEVVLVCAWRLLGMVLDGTVFSDRAVRHVDVVIGALGAAWVLAAGFALRVAWRADDPGTPLLLFVVLLFAAVFGLLLVVARQVLRQGPALVPA